MSAGRVDRNRVMADRYAAGATLAEIGAEFGVTRERVRQVLDELGIDRRRPGSVRTGRVEGAAAWLAEEGPQQLEVVAERFGVTAATVKGWIRDGRLDPGLIVVPRRRRVLRWSREDAVAAVAAAWKRSGGGAVFTRSRYDEFRSDGDPSGIWIATEWGWGPVTIAAGIPGARVRRPRI